MATALAPASMTGDDVRDKFRAFLWPVANVPLEVIAAVIDEEMTIWETAEMPWSPTHEEPLTTEELRFLSAPLRTPIPKG